MNKQESLPFNASPRTWLEARGSGTLLGILFVFIPWALLGVFGESLGAGSALSNVVLVLAYVLSLGIATLIMKPWGWSWRALGLRRPAHAGRTVVQAIVTLLIGLAFIVITQIIVQSLAGPGGPASDQSEYNPISGNLPLLLGMLVATWTNVAFGEEMLFRGFLQNALGRPFLETKLAVPMTVVGSSIAFGLAHYAWGWLGVLEMVMFGLVVGTAYVRSGRNLWVPIIAHGLADSLKFVLIFLAVV